MAAADDALERGRGEDEPRDVPYAVIARRAYEIWESGEGGTAQENWKRAAEELGADPKR